MKDLFTPKTAKIASAVLAVLFLVFILYVGISCFPKALDTTQQLISGSLSLGEYIRLTNQEYESLLTTEDEYPFFLNLGTYANLNGFLARLLGQPMLNERVTLKNGHLAQWLPEPIPQDSLEASADNIASLYHQALQDGKNFLFILTPGQICKYEDMLPAGYTDATNETSDRLLALLEDRGVPYMDMREFAHQQGLSHTELFFVTDHHWTPEAGFWAYTQILAELESRGMIPAVDSYYTDPENYDFKTYENCFLGSSGKRTGIYFAGLDDFCVITPKFPTKITVTYPSQNKVYQGSYFETVNNPYTEESMQNPNYFIMNHYGMYGRSDTEQVLRENKNAPLDQKIMLIGDSFTNVPGSLLSLYAQSSFELDMRYLEGDFTRIYTEYNADTVLLMINATGCNDENICFPFFQ